MESSNLISTPGLDAATSGRNSTFMVQDENDGMTPLATWGFGFLFVTIINLSSIMGIIFFPLMKKSFYALMMRIMIGLAIGSLSGSALFHLIPAAFGISEESHPSYLKITSFVWFAIWIVMILECSIKIGVKMKTKSKQKREFKRRSNATQNNNPSTVVHINNGEVVPLSSSLENGIKLDYADMGEDDEVGELSDDPHLKLNDPNIPVYRSTLSLNKMIDKINTRDEDSEKKKEIKTVAWIIIIGDSLHNFIDGVSIGAGFVQSFRAGFVLSLAVMCEEFPHELGDFAILINSGLSVKKALVFNFLSALTCYLGLILGILLGEIEWANLIFAFAAGIFLYVALGDMVPEVTSLIDEVSDVSPKKAWKVMLSHNFGILIGISILFILANFQP